MKSTRRDALATLAALPLVCRSAVASEAYPRRTMTWVVPFAPGGISDTSTQAVARRVARLLGQAVVVDFRPGAGGSIGTDQVARAPADGYTLLYGSSGTLAANLSLYRGLRYRPLVDFAPVHGLFESSTVLVVGASRPWATLTELLNEARARPVALNYGSAGAGTGTHLVAELLQVTAGVKLQHVPYKGTAAALPDLLAGRLDLMCEYLPGVLPHVLAGRLRVLAVMGPRRLSALPEVPTVAQAGHPGAALASWSALVAPAGTPPGIVAMVSRTVGAALADPEVVGSFVSLGAVPLQTMDAAALRDHIAAEIPRWAELVKRSGATLG